MAAKAVQVNRQGGGKRLTFTGRHFGNRTFVEHEAADHLHVEGHHAERLHRFRIEFADLRVDRGRHVDFPFVLAGGKFSLGGVGVLLQVAELAEVEVVFGLEDVEDTQAAVTGFLANGEGFDLDVVEGRTVFQLFAELGALRGEGGVIQSFQGLACLVNLRDHGAELLHLAFMGGTENLVEYRINYAHNVPL